MARKKFLRGKWRTYSKLGKGRKKKQKYRKAKGRHNKIREKMKGNPKKVSIGYKKSKKPVEKRKGFFRRVLKKLKEKRKKER